MARLETDLNDRETDLLFTSLEESALRCDFDSEEEELQKLIKKLKKAMEKS